MFSLQRILGRDDEFCALLEASAQEACQSVATLKRVLADRTTAPSLEAFASARRKDKQLTNEIAELLIRAFVTAMEREDIEALAETLYTVLQMVKALRAGTDIAGIKQLNANIQKIESDADDLILELIGRLYVPGFPPLKGVIVKDLFELNEKVVDRCRDAGNVITRVVLKNT
jgi:hypothetical protein